MPTYTEADLIRARRPLADPSERGDAYCTLGHLEVEQRESPTAERAGIIGEITAHIAAFDGAPARTGAPEPAAPTSAAPVSPPAPAFLSQPALPPAPVPTLAVGGLQAGIAASTASMKRTLLRQGMTPLGQAPAGASVGATSMARTLRRMGLTPQARG